ncbi:hypothetical protein HNP72_001595 [Sphingobacterium soli]|uniref:Uncharacterized protein n=1 Tax=Sphingobacterium cellulitidis TaxID=1768011 RepID=A0A8H9KTI9_9SPHI|nr:hypothetical protein [Sphingobacterium soli]GGE20432.1 hypothetical protein GCM10011516_17570 [Sphingobacterium soli]
MIEPHAKKLYPKNFFKSDYAIFGVIRNKKRTYWSITSKKQYKLKKAALKQLFYIITHSPDLKIAYK